MRKWFFRIIITWLTIGAVIGVVVSQMLEVAVWLKMSYSVMFVIVAVWGILVARRYWSKTWEVTKK